MSASVDQAITYRSTRVGGCLDVNVERVPDGTTILRAVEPLGAFPDRITDRLEHFAAVAPDRTFVARRDPTVAGGGEWMRISYAQMLDRARRVGQALVERDLSPDRPVAILSDNDLEHLTLALGALWVGVPYVPISAAYSLVSSDYAKLRYIVERVTPGLVFAAGRADSSAYAPALAAIAHDGFEVIRGDDGGFDTLLAAVPDQRVEAAHAAVGPDTIAKILFTSGSTRHPKGVVNTHRMLCTNQQMLRQTFAFLADEPPVLVDWLPWNHTFGGNHNVGITLYNGGTLYIDEGKPTAKGIATTLRNLREISPTVYFNVPKGFEEIAAAMEDDPALRASLFARVAAFMFAGAGLSQAVWDQFDRLAVATVGQRIPMFTGLGMTETAPACMFEVRAHHVRAGYIGLPCPGVEARLVPEEGDAFAKTEIRFRGPNVMPGYWREPKLSDEAFDELGFYRTGDAVRWVDDSDPSRGLSFDGRIAEDFKLDTGTFVSVGPLRTRVIAEGSPLVQDVVVTGIDRGEVGILVLPRIDECRRLTALGADASATDVLGHPAVSAFFQALIDRLWTTGSGSANRVARAALLVDPPSIDRGEITDKGSINQRAVLVHRARLIDALYEQGAELAFAYLPQVRQFDAHASRP